MLWAKKRKPDAPAERDLIEPADLPVEFDPALFRQHMTTLVEVAQVDGGVSVYLDSLEAKHRVFASALAEESLGELDTAALEELLEVAFTARRKLHPLFAEKGAADTVAAIRDVLYGNAPVDARLARFVEAMPIHDGAGREARSRAARLRRAAHDFAAELLHFRDPIRYPLMARWVWDASTMSGAVREFVRNPDGANQLPLDMRPETFEGARRWLAGLLEAEGIYRDIPFWVDLLQASAYAHYFRSMTGGVLGSDFSRTGGPEEQVKKLLGIDGERRSGRSRVKKDIAAQGEA